MCTEISCISGGLHNLSQNFQILNHNQVTDEDPIYDLPPDDNLDYQSIESSAGNQFDGIALLAQLLAL